MRAAAEGREGSHLELLAVTVLTSFDHEDLADLGYHCLLEDLVALRVRNAMQAGMNGLVCSPREVEANYLAARHGLVALQTGPHHDSDSNVG
ncbi:MAG: hypothetical protein HYZ57_18145 [Acidobacteria bacterium]|nr:hypothetical protein [Acidobacteriota bacterium]